NLFSQVTIGTDINPEKAALLDLKTKNGSLGEPSSDNGGLLLPRVEITNLTDLGIFTNVTGLDTQEEKLKHKGLTVYNIGNADIEEGIYAWDGSKWQKAGLKKEINFFYMPSIKIPINTPPQPIELFTEYQTQFLTPKVASEGAPATIPYFLNAEDLYYYVTDYDENVFESITISNTGRMTYTLKDPLPSDACCSFINIVFVIK
ncbi:MAG: hypothetical protein LIO93_07325, partial [Bacteroidales bacterium]|nr:hypothetical protein [Bacteroidales bacterium]